MIPAVLRARARSCDEDGSAIVEFVLLVGPLFIPLVYLITSAFEVQRTAFAAAEGARQAARAYVTASTSAAATSRALFAANLATVDQGLPALRASDISIDAPDDLCRGGRVTVTLHGKATLPFLPRRLATVAVSATHTELIDDLRQLPACQ